MNFVETPIAGLWVIELERRVDARGFFARSFCEDEFRERGLHTDWPQTNLSFNERMGTLRGLHYQRTPHEEPKLVRCTRGRIFDVAVDLRDGSPTRGKWFAIELDDEKRDALYIPKGFAHGFQALCSGAEVTYQMGARYAPEAAAGIRWDDPTLRIPWPIPEIHLSDRDAGFPMLT